MRNLYDGVPIDEVHKAAILAARTLIEKDPAYTLRHRAPAAAHDPPRDPRRGGAARRTWRRATPSTSRSSSRRASAPSCSTRSCCSSTCSRLGAALKAERDLQFDYLGLQTLYDRYFLHMRRSPHRAAAGVLHARGDGPGAERDRPRGARDRVLRRAVDASTSCRSTPTLFNAGTLRSQLSSCYLTTVADDLDGIYEAIKENALLVEVRRRPGQRLDPRARARLAHQGHQRQVARAWCRS